MSKVLTISIAAYNMEQFIARCLDSFCGCKNLDSLEIIVNDNGATDQTDRIVQAYVDQYPDVFHLIKRKVNGNYGAVLNTAIQIATGKYFKLVDGDDWVDPDALDHLIDVLRNTNADVVINNYCNVYSNGTKLIDVHGNHKYGVLYTFDTLKSFNPYQMHAVTVRLEQYRKHMTSVSENKVYVDNEYILQVFMAVDSFLFMKEAIYQHRLGRPGQGTSLETIYSHLEDVSYVGENLFDIYTKSDHTAWGKGKKKWLLYFMEKEYRWVLGYFTLTQKCDKDWALNSFLSNVNRKYGKIINGFYLGIYRLLLINFFIGIKILRELKKIKYTYITKYHRL